MELDSSPPLEPLQAQAVALALESLPRLQVTRRPASAWWRAGVAEAIEPREGDDEGYAFSPRSTRGATRA